MLTYQRSPSWLAALVIAMTLVLTAGWPGAAAADNVWDQLSDSEKKQVLNQLKDNLPKLLQKSPLKENLVAISKNVDQWSTLAGEVSGGRYDHAVDLVVENGRQQFFKQFEKQLDAHVSGLPESMQFVYEHMKKNQDVFLEIARSMARGDWKKAEKQAWDHAAGEVDIYSRATLRNAYNWVFDNASVRGVTPADAFLYVVQAEIEIIPKLERMLQDGKLESMYKKYRELDSDWNAFVDQGGDLGVGTAFGRSGGFATWGLTSGDLRRLFETCDTGSIGQCMRDRAREARNRIAAQKRALDQAMRQAGEAESKEIRAALDAIQAEARRLALDRDTEFKSAIAEAEKLSRLMDKAAGEVRAQCDAFDQKAEVAGKALQKVTDAEDAVSVVKQYIDDGAACASLGDDIKGLTGDLTRMKQIAADFSGALDMVVKQSREVCNKTAELKSAASRTAGRSILDQASKKTRDLQGSVGKAESAIKQLRAGHGDLVSAVGTVRSSLDKARRGSDKAKVEKAFETIQSTKGARNDFEGAVAAMKTAVAKMDNLTKSISSRNPVEMSTMDYVESALEGGVNRTEKTRIFKLLEKYKDVEEVRQIMDRAKQSLESMRCADDVHRQWDDAQSTAGRWSFRKWRDPEIPDGLESAYETTRKQCDNLAGADSLEKLKTDADSLMQDAEGHEVGLWVYKKDADECIADGVVALAQLPDAAAALPGRVGELETACKQATQSAAAALDAAVKAQTAAADLGSKAAGLAPSADARNAVGGCGQADAVRDGVLQSVARVKSSAANAVAAKSKAESLLSACVDKGSIDAADAAANEARRHARDAVLAYGQAQQGDELFDRLTESAKNALAGLRQLRDQGRALDAAGQAAAGHIADARRLKSEAESLFAQCKALQSQVLAEYNAAAGANPDSTTAALLARINGVSTEPKGLEAVDSASSLVDTATAQVASRLKEIDAAVAGAEACANAQSPYVGVLEAGEAILSLEGIADGGGQFGRLRSDCVAHVGQHDNGSAVAGSAGSASGGGCVEYDPTDPACDEEAGSPSSGDNQPVDMAGIDAATAAAGITPPAAQDGGGGQGEAIPPTYGEDPVQNVKDAAEVARAQNESPFGPRAPPPPGSDIAGDFGSAPDISKIPDATGHSHDAAGSDAGNKSSSGESGNGGKSGNGGQGPAKTASAGGSSTGGQTGSSSPGGATGGSGSCQKATADFTSYAQSAVSRLSLGEDEQACGKIADFDREILRLGDAVEKACGKPIQGIDIVRQQLNQFAAQCPGAGTASSGGASGGGPGGGSELSTSPLFGGGNPCSSCREALYVNCMGLDQGSDDSFCRQHSDKCPACPGGADLSCSSVRQACIQDLMYLKHQNRPDWDMDTLRQKAESSCLKCG